MITIRLPVTARKHLLAVFSDIDECETQAIDDAYVWVCDWSIIRQFYSHIRRYRIRYLFKFSILFTECVGRALL